MVIWLDGGRTRAELMLYLPAIIDYPFILHQLHSHLAFSSISMSIFLIPQISSIGP